MIQNVVTSVVVFGIIYSIYIIWKYSLIMTESLFSKVIKKKSSGSLDIDNLVRFIILIITVLLVWFPIIYVLTLIFD